MHERLAAVMAQRRNRRDHAAVEQTPSNHSRAPKAGENGGSARRRVVPCIESRSQNLDRRGENIAGTAFCLDQLRLALIGLELAAQSQNLNVNAAIEHLLVVHPTGGEQLLAGQYLLR